MDTQKQAPPQQGLIKRLRQALRDRIALCESSELEQSLIRVAIGLIISIYFFSPAFSDLLSDEALLPAARSMVPVFLVFSLSVSGAILVRPGRSPVRRLIGIFGDVFTVSVCLYLGGEGGVPLLAVYLWISMGNGFRYGVPYLWAATFLSVVGFGIVFSFNPYWSSHTLFSISMLILFTIIPIYTATRLRRMNDAIHRANEASKANSQFLANRSPEPHTPLNGVIATSDLPRQTKPREELQDTRVLVLVSQVTGSGLRDSFSSWNLATKNSKTCARAISELVEASERGVPYSVLVVEASHLDLEPEQFAMVVKSERLLRQLSLVLIAGQGEFRGYTRLLDSGYSAVLQAPVDKALLFNAIHAAPAEQETPENVVSLVDRYEQHLQGEKGPLRILLAEDNETNQLVLRHILEQAGHDVYVAADGEKALDLLEDRTHDFDLMILDLNMPRLGGLDVMEAFRFMDPKAETPVIVLTADATPEASRACKEAGVDAYLTKPVRTDKLLSTIAAVRRSKAKQRELPRLSAAQRPKDPPENRVSVDYEVLNGLMELGSGTEFFEDLVYGFIQDGERNLEKMHRAIRERDYPAFSDALHALKGTAGEMGANHLVQLCNEAKTRKPFNMGTEGPQELFATIESALGSTSVLLSEFVQARRNAST